MPVVELGIRQSLYRACPNLASHGPSLTGTTLKGLGRVHVYRLPGRATAAASEPRSSESVSALPVLHAQFLRPVFATSRVWHFHFTSAEETG
eukprot:3318943-Rhodomonas_salina.1